PGAAVLPAERLRPRRRPRARSRPVDAERGRRPQPARPGAHRPAADRRRHRGVPRIAGAAAGQQRRVRLPRTHVESHRPPMTTYETRCCVAGGGPAGMMLGVLLARAGVHVVVLEKHADFLRDFRGDTVHPSTLEVMHELGVLDDFLARPHSELREARGMIGDERVTIADFRHLPVHAPFIAMVPQWEFLDFLAQFGRRYPTFELLMHAEAFELIERDARICGVRVAMPDGAMDLYADLVIGADGRTSTVRDLARLPVQEIGAPIDVLWTRLPKLADDDRMATLGNI